ncbi:MAG: MFS transporter [Dehalococcoidia bacterium]
MKADEPGSLLAGLPKNPRRIFYGWWILVSSCIIMGFSSGIITYGATVFFSPVANALNLSRTATSLALALSRMENTLLAYPIGYCIDRFGPRPMALAGMTLLGTGLILFGLFANSLFTFILFWTFMVALGGTIGGYAPHWAALNNWFVKKKGRAMGIGMSAQALGGFLIAPALALMISLWDWRAAAVIAGVAVLAVALPVASVIRTRPSDMGLRPDGDVRDADPPGAPSPTAATPTTVHRHTIINFTLKQATRTRSLWLLSTALGMRQLVQGGVIFHLSPMLQDSGYSGVQAGSMVGLVAFLAIFGAITVGTLSDRFERRKVAAAISIVEAGSLFILFFAGTGWPVYLFLVGYGFAQGTHTLNRAILGEYFGQSHYARLWGVMSTATTPLSFAGPVFAGWMFDTTGTYNTVILIFAVLLACNVLVYYNCRRPSTPVS